MLQVTFTNNEDGVLTPEITIDAAAVNAMMRLAKKQESLTTKKQQHPEFYPPIATIRCYD